MHLLIVNGIKSAERLPNGDVLIEAHTTERKPNDAIVLKIERPALHDILRELGATKAING